VTEQEVGGEDQQGRLARLRALAVRADTQPTLLALASRLRRRLPGDERYGDPLSTAGRKPVDVVARGVSALQPPRPSVSSEIGMAALQLWQELSEAQGRGRGQHDVALLFTDLVDFSAWALRAGDEATLTLLREVGTVVEESIIDRYGTIVKRLGDGVMAVFDTAQEAVDAALDAQVRLEAVEVDGYRPRMRAGVHHGRPRKIGSDYLGVDVNVAARVGEAAGAGQVLVSEPAFALIDAEALKVGRAKSLRAQGTPKGLRVRNVARR
jgi:adenylate cyclase